MLPMINGSRLIMSFIFNKRRKGIGRAHRDGLAWAYKKKFAYVITMDSDLAHHPKYILQVLKKKKYSSYYFRIKIYETKQYTGVVQI